jgi:hypothetical protein
VIPGYRKYRYPLLIETLKKFLPTYLIRVASGCGRGVLTVFVDHITKREHKVMCLDRKLFDWITGSC